MRFNLWDSQGQFAFSPVPTSEWSPFGMFTSPFGEGKSFIYLWALEKETWVQKEQITCLLFTDSGPELRWNHTTSRFPLETCPVSHPEAGLASISFHSLTLPHLGYVHLSMFLWLLQLAGGALRNHMTWDVVLSLTFKHVLRNEPFPGIHTGSPQGE